MMRREFLCVALPTAAVLLIASGLAGAADIVPTDIMMPGTQPNEVQNFESPDKCDNCHGGYDAARVWSNEPAFGWRGGAMGNAGRDPIFWATLAIAEQDFDGAGDLCIRCHSAAGWYAGRSTPTDGSGLLESDDEGIDCDTCHQATNPDKSDLLLQGVISPGFEPYDIDPHTGEVEGYYGSGILSVWGSNDKLGPYNDAEARHQFEQSAFHRGKICGSCHDVSNPAVGDLAPGNGAQPGNALPEGSFNSLPNILDPNQDPTTKAAFNNPPYAYGIVERTFSEYIAGGIDDTLVTEFHTLPPALRVSGGALSFAYNAAMQAGGTYEDGTPRYFNCQGCHMRPDTGEGCNKKGVPTRTDLPKHDQSGGNYWMWPLIQYQDQEGTLRMGGGLTQTQIEAMDAGQQRAEQQLQMAATLEVIGSSVKITNLTGHKLITGYPEGRRMWLHVQWYCGGSPCGELGEYGPLSGTNFTNPVDGAPFIPQSIIDLDDPYLRIYDAHYAITKEWADTLANVVDPAAGTSFGSIILDYDRITGAPGPTIKELADGTEAYRESFHFVLNNHVSKDNRIPPYGFDGTEARKRNALPVPADQYGGNGAGTTYRYWDEFGIDDLNPPTHADAADLTLYYQGTSWEYVQFLWLANNTPAGAFLADEGKYMLDAWINADPAAPMVPPFVMATATWGDTGCSVTEQTEVTCDDGLDNDCDGLFDSADPNCAGCTPVSATDTTCDGLDDDCNGLIDDGYVPLTTYCGVGECVSSGTEECVDGSLIDNCTPGTPVSATDTTCDGLDDDCNGLIDDGYVPLATYCGLGECVSSGTEECVDGSLVDNCTPGPPGTEGPYTDPLPDTCTDTLDNDCDGFTDAGDVDCQPPMTCPDYQNKTECNADPNCRWKRNQCQNR
jgi:hypothetical protein